ncbi:DUF4194 domain-containing protein [Methanolobus sp. WCC1]|uniref:DUF4194 domain-containing protein n=1 Tax=unclassified Methanolobus TaxID=2629569 RepID=UPI00324FA32A
MTETNNYLPYAISIIKLLKGNVFKNDAIVWDNLIQYKPALKNYFSSIGIELFVHEDDGYAFLRQKKYDEQTEPPLPSLISKRPLSYHMTLLCVLLVERLYEDQRTTGNDSAFCSIDRKTIVTMMKSYMPTSSNEAKIEKDINTLINKAKDYGFLRELSTDKDVFEIRTILFALIDNEIVHEIQKKLQEHAQDMENENDADD